MIDEEIEGLAFKNRQDKFYLLPEFSHSILSRCLSFIIINHYQLTKPKKLEVSIRF